MHAADVAPYAGDLVVPVTVNATPTRRPPRPDDRGRVAQRHLPVVHRPPRRVAQRHVERRQRARPHAGGRNRLSPRGRELAQGRHEDRQGRRAIQSRHLFAELERRRLVDRWHPVATRRPQHGLWPGVASASPNVYAIWVRVAKVRSWSKSASRSIWFRRNSNHGSGAWATAKRLTAGRRPGRLPVDRRRGRRRLHRVHERQYGRRQAAGLARPRQDLVDQSPRVDEPRLQRGRQVRPGLGRCQRQPRRGRVAQRSQRCRSRHGCPRRRDPPGARRRP